MQVIIAVRESQLELAPAPSDPLRTSGTDRGWMDEWMEPVNVFYVLYMQILSIYFSIVEIELD